MMEIQKQLYRRRCLYHRKLKERPPVQMEGLYKAFLEGNTLLLTHGEDRYFRNDDFVLYRHHLIVDDIKMREKGRMGFQNASHCLYELLRRYAFAEGQDRGDIVGSELGISHAVNIDPALCGAQGRGR